jgi:hypothetical protein
MALLGLQALGSVYPHSICDHDYISSIEMCPHCWDFQFIRGLEIIWRCSCHLFFPTLLPLRPRHATGRSRCFILQADGIVTNVFVDVRIDANKFQKRGPQKSQAHNPWVCRGVLILSHTAPASISRAYNRHDVASNLHVDLQPDYMHISLLSALFLRHGHRIPIRPYYHGHRCQLNTPISSVRKWPSKFGQSFMINMASHYLPLSFPLASFSSQPDRPCL